MKLEKLMIAVTQLKEVVEGLDNVDKQILRSCEDNPLNVALLFQQAGINTSFIDIPSLSENLRDVATKLEAHIVGGLSTDKWDSVDTVAFGADCVDDDDMEYVEHLISFIKPLMKLLPFGELYAQASYYQDACDEDQWQQPHIVLAETEIVKHVVSLFDQMEDSVFTSLDYTHFPIVYEIILEYWDGNTVHATEYRDVKAALANDSVTLKWLKELLALYICMVMVIHVRGW